MGSRVQYSVDESVATIVLDDGKVNVLSPAMQEEIHAALDSAAKDHAGAVVIAGNQKVFSAGFDLSVLRGENPDAALDMLAGGFDLSGAAAVVSAAGGDGLYRAGDRDGVVPAAQR